MISKSFHIFFTALLFLLINSAVPIIGVAQSTGTGKEVVQLHSNWTFRQEGKTEWLSAGVPGNVHMDLLDNKKIPDPFWGTNEKELQWIENENWEYKSSFVVSKLTAAKENADLVFYGLDTYAEVFLNEKKILDAGNMFREWRVDVKRILKAGENSIRVRFRSPIKEALPLYDSLPFHYPANNDQAEKKVSVFTRKAGFHFGWDWGPRFVTSGIWRPVELQVWNTARINNVQLTQKTLNKSKAELIAIIEITAEKAGKIQVLMQGEVPSISAAPVSINLTPGINLAEIPITIFNPELWWPNGLGKQRLYGIKTTISIAGKVLDIHKKTIGLRTIEVVNAKDKDGKSLYLKINGQPCFMKGANYIPSDNFQNRVTQDKYKMLVQSAVDANMNMLRVWGGGIYEEDYFYQLCDEKGILLWQDFMFGCSMYPGDTAFVKNVEEEATDNVRRLRDHPSLALWCGNNEMETAWQHWGWQKQLGLTQEQQDKIWTDYKKIFHEVLPGVIAKNDSSRFYQRSSPSANEDQVEAEKEGFGDKHYWGVWHAEEPYQAYKNNISRFMSEYGFQSFPELKTVQAYAEAKDWDIASTVMLHHQRHPRGNQLIREYMNRDYKTPKDFPSFLYVGQVLQAEIIKFGAEAHRRAMPYNMGTLYWQLDDCWPVASWSGMDYYGRWKAQHYFARKFFQNILPSFNEKKDSLEVFIVSDLLEKTKARLTITLKDFSGKKLFEKNIDTIVPANSSKILWAIKKDVLLAGKSKNEVVVQLRLKAGVHGEANNLFYFVAPKDLKLPKVKINPVLRQEGKKIKIELNTEFLAKNVYLNSSAEGFFSDNYFDLLPGEQKTIEFSGKEEINLEDFMKSLTLINLADSFE